MGIDLQTLQQWAHAWLPVLLDAAVKGAVLLVATGLVVMAMRRKSAAARQVVWLLALAAMLVLPAASAALPSWGVLPGWAKLEMPAQQPQSLAPSDESLAQQHAPAMETPPSPDPQTPESPAAAAAAPVTPADVTLSQSAATGDDESATAASVPEPAPSAAAALPAQSPWLTATLWLLLLWAGGMAVCLAPVLLGRLSLWRLARSSGRIDGGSWAALAQRAAQAIGLRRCVQLLQSRDEPMPMVWGVLRPKLLLPAEAENWSAERRWVVLLHEMAHAKRHDCLAKLVAHVACAFYWFNPLAWMAFKSMQREAEAACDDLVLSSDHASTGLPNLRPSDYAQHLLEIASGLKSGMLAAYSSIAMARKSKLEGRLLAILDDGRNRRSLTRWGLLVAAVLVSGIVLPISILKATAATQSGPFKEATISVYTDLKSGKYLGGGKLWSVLKVTDSKQLAALQAFFPKLGTGKSSDTVSGWIAGAEIKFAKPDGKTLTVYVSANDDLTVWNDSQGTGDWPVKGDLKAFLLAVQKQQPATAPASAPATQPASRPTVSASEAVCEQVAQVAVKALSTRPIDENLLRSALRQAVLVNVGYQREGDRDVHMTNAQRVRLARQHRGDVSRDWIDSVSTPLEKRPKVSVWLLLDVPDELRADRDRALAQANEHLRTGLLKLAEKFPFITHARDWQRKVVNPPARLGKADSLGFGLEYPSGQLKGDISSVPKAEQFSIMAVIIVPQEEELQLATRPIYPCLGLEGQCGAWAGNAELDKELKKLLAEAIAPLGDLDTKAANIIMRLSATQPATAPASAPATQPGRSVFGEVQTVVLSSGIEIALDLDSGRTQFPPAVGGLHEEMDVLVDDKKAVARPGGLEGTVVQLDRPQGLIALHGLKTVAAPNVKWDASPDEVLRTLSQNGLPPVKKMSAQELPATFCFRTAENGVGVLQLVSVVDIGTAKSLKLRYRLVQSTVTTQLTTRAAGQPATAPASAPATQAMATITQPATVRASAPATRTNESASNRAYTAYWQATDELLKGTSRESVAAMFAAVAEILPDAPPGNVSADLAARLREMVVEDKSLVAPADPSKLSQKDRLDWLVYSLRDVAEREMFIPGKCEVLFFPRTKASAAVELRKMGKAAVPTLIGLLNDRRPTRSSGVSMNGGVVLRYEDVALQIIEAIAGRQFDKRSERGTYLSNASLETRKAIIQEVDAWWQANKHRSEVQWLREALAGGMGMHWFNLGSADRLIELEGKGSLDLFRKLAKSEPNNAQVALKLYAAGGNDAIGDLRGMLDSPNAEVRVAVRSLLIKAGQKDVLERVRGELAAAVNDPKTAGDLLEILAGSRKPDALRIVVGYVDQPGSPLVGAAIRAIDHASIPYEVGMQCGLPSESLQAIVPSIAAAMDNEKVALEARYLAAGWFIWIEHLPVAKPSGPKPASDAEQRAVIKQVQDLRRRAATQPCTAPASGGVFGMVRAASAPTSVPTSLPSDAIELGKLVFDAIGDKKDDKLVTSLLAKGLAYDSLPAIPNEMNRDALHLSDAYVDGDEALLIGIPLVWLNRQAEAVVLHLRASRTAGGWSITAWQGSEVHDSKILSAFLKEHPSAKHVYEAPPLTPPPGGRMFEIKLVDAVTGKPLKDVVTRTRADGKGYSLITDATGTVSFPLASQRSKNVLLAVRHRGYVSVSYLPGDDVPENYTLKMQPGRTIGGIVQNEDGEPIAHVDVSTWPGSEDLEAPLKFMRLAKAFTDEQGRWWVDGVPADTNGVSVRLHHENYVSERQWHGAGPMDDLWGRTNVLVLKQSKITVSGVVYGPNNKPLAGATVYQGKSKFGVSYPRTTADAQGRYVFEHTPPGKLMLITAAEGYGPELEALEAKEDMAPVDFHLAKSKPLRARVEDQSGNPVIGATISVASWRGCESLDWTTTTDANGLFEWNAAPADAVKLRISDGKDGPGVVVEVQPSDDEQVLTLPGRAPKF